MLHRRVGSTLSGYVELTPLSAARFGWLDVFSVQTCLAPSCLRRGTEIPGGAGRGRLYLTLHCDHQNDCCINKMVSDESHFNVSLIVKDKVSKTVSINHNF